MGNQIRYRNHTHAPGEVAFEINQLANINPESGVADTVTHMWTLSGELLADGGADNQADLTTRMTALAQAYSVNGGDLMFLLDSGAPSAHLIRSNATLGGTKVRYFDWVNGGGAEYTSHRSYRIGIEAVYPLNTRSGLSYWKETIEFWGGGPKVRHQESVKGRPRPQQIKAYTTYHARQFGTIVGLYDYAPYPSPIWRGTPPHLSDLDRKSPGNPTPQGIAGAARFKDYPRSYSYEFESATPLFGIPNFWFV